MINSMCNNCNEYLKEFNKIFSLDSFWFEHYKTRYCTSGSIGFDDKAITCLTIYGARIKYYAEEYNHNQPERSKREDFVPRIYADCSCFEGSKGFEKHPRCTNDFHKDAVL